MVNKEDLLANVKSLFPQVNVEYSSNVNYFCDELAGHLSSLYYEMNLLQFKYNISENDLYQVGYILKELQGLPANVIRKMLEK